jgi:hypothetical protein
MSFEFDDLKAGGQLRVGSGAICPPIKEGDHKINGSMHAEGPVVFGEPGAEAKNRATLIVNRTENDDEDCEDADRSVWVNGNMFLNGDDGTPYALNQVGNTIINGNDQTPYTLNIQSKAGFAININGHTWIDDEGEAVFKTGTGGAKLSARFATADALGKVFDMPHPTRGKGHRLSHACIEGPEIGVYYRGRVRNEKIIALPSYWKGLVHEDSISVQLQPIGSHQDVIVTRWDIEKIYLQSKGGMPIDCFYHIYAERKDVNPLHVEYEGDTCFDYPDPNHLNKNPNDPKRNLLDPRYRGPRNTITK